MADDKVGNSERANEGEAENSRREGPLPGKGKREERQSSRSDARKDTNVTKK